MLPRTEALNITHPLINAMYMKRDFTNPKHGNVLVIDTNFADSDEEHDAFDSYLTDLLLDLEDLKQQAEAKVGKFDRVDIRTH